MVSKKLNALIIVLMQQKGGVGKTTIATNLAAEFSKLYKTLLIDCDEQGSVGVFGAGRSQALGEMNNLSICGKTFRLADTSLANGKAIRQEIKPFKEDYELIIIDSPGGERALSKALASLADLVILPIQPGAYDAAAMMPTIRDLEELMGINEYLQARILFNRRDDQTSLSQEVGAFDFINTNEDIFPMNSSLGNRTLYGRSAQGLTVVEMDHRSKAAGEILALMKEIEEILNMEEKENGEETAAAQVAA